MARRRSRPGRRCECGLALAWTAALVALLAVGLGGWSLLDLSERRIRFVSAVTHELRTPLTTLRLYLDMLTGGMVARRSSKSGIPATLNAETDRLNRLVGNVLDFSRLENQRPRLDRAPVTVADLLDRSRPDWQGRCQGAGRNWSSNSVAAEHGARPTCQLVQQVLGNLLDNACKYSRGAEDRRLWLRVRPEGGTAGAGGGGPRAGRAGPRAALDLPALPPRPRGRRTAGGVGLGLALAERRTQLLGGRLTLDRAKPEGRAAAPAFASRFSQLSAEISKP